ncbi:phosphate ABC transporter permease subunit PstC [candidate division KSB1 bacterium]|nr:phosphate ABC transporter permease subunit PstC [candidate division KSB1 bacterium]NIR69354.1 phosphate ABC transporter permease subunit PstC [candidate division KSB1 bacterium]NIS24172.1 phosphate ABC transporter permease subunit PstC [candidate division KSB1 bacterium]NIT71087.1 phosphate ABC transporter permease subunit PstC [candidate division KSB1 bacterium]NIU24791.1 phosphate ABC transporter permease subunit PstC [candidate division KSB1 bacterium]
MSQSKKWKPAKAVFALAFVISISIIGIIFVFLVKDSLPIYQRDGWGFFIGRKWFIGEIYGALPMIYGTVVVTFLAICFAIPLALGSAILASEILPGRARLVIKMVMELLAGIPGVVYGLLGIVMLTTLVKNLFGLLDGNSILTAGILLGMMTLPTIMTLSEDALRAVPKEYREQALALGLGRSEAIVYAVLPSALKGIVGAVLLGISRAIGETIAVMLVIGSLDRIPHPFYNVFSTAQTITSKLGREAAEAIGVGYHWNALIGLGLVLFLIVMGITFVGDFIIVKDHAK